MRIALLGSPLIARASKFSLLTISIFGMMSWLLIPSHAEAANVAKAKAKKKVAAQRETVERGRLTSFQDGVLKIKVRKLGSDTWDDRQWTIASGTDVVSYIRGVATKGAAPEAFKPWEQNPGVTVIVRSANGKVRFVEIGSKKAAKALPKKPAEEVARAQ